MKLETAIIIVKGLCYVAVGAGVAWSSSLAQWVNSGETPGHIHWYGVIIPASIIGAGNALLSFLSGSYRTYMDDRKTNGDGKPPTP